MKTDMASCVVGCRGMWCDSVWCGVVCGTVSGGVWGIGQGVISQINVGFLSDHMTDFIFSVLAQYFGFVMTTIYISILLSVLWCSNIVACSCKNNTDRIIKKTYIFRLFAFLVFLWPFLGRRGFQKREK